MTAPEPGPVTSLDDVAIRYDTAAGPYFARVRLVDKRTGREVLALTPDQAATLAGSLGFAAGRARAGLAEVQAGQS